MYEATSGTDTNNAVYNYLDVHAGGRPAKSA